MTLSDFLQLLAELAQADKIDRYAVVVGLAVQADGSGRTTDATDMPLAKGCPYGANETEWSTPEEGAAKLELELLRKLRAIWRENGAREAEAEITTGGDA